MAAPALREIRNFDDLLIYLEEKLDWPLQGYSLEDAAYTYEPAELGLKDEDAARIKAIHQLRPLIHGQPWGIFFVEFENKKLPVVVLRRILSHLVIKKRAAANKAAAPAWHAEDLLFVTAFGEDSTDAREIAFAHFHQNPGDLPTLHVLGWDGGDTPLKLTQLDQTLRTRLRWPEDESDANTWRETWRKPFRHKIGHVIRTADLLAEELARLARGIRDKTKRMLAAESDKGPLTKLYKAFQTALIHDLTEAHFADTYAQTITYGLLTAAISRTEMSEGRHGTALLADDIADIVPVTNPFLKEMLQTFLKVGGRRGGIDFDELGIQDVVELLRGDETDLPAVIADFGNKNPNEDPVIHFYEHFLAAYDKPQKKQRGVFYTPQPVVSYIVRSVHELLQTEFGLEDGLASTITWGEMAARFRHSRLRGNDGVDEQPGFVIPAGTSPNSPFVTILDPATGTATFLVEVINVIHRTLTEKWTKQGLNETQRQADWNVYVPKHLLPRLYGYELMMAPYAIAHMKIGLKLFETGYRFGSEERVRVYLTNALEPATDAKGTNIALEALAPALAHEALAVNTVKRSQRFTVVIGNPPYSNFGQLNKIPFIHELLEDYKRGLNERKLNLDDDFIKFIRLAHYVLDAAHTGISGMITNNVFIDGITHRQMRRSLQSSFPLISVCDLHGSVKKLEVAPDGSKDENVFDIQQGVGIMFLANPPRAREATVHFSELWGRREAKYAALALATLDQPASLKIACDKPYHFFAPKLFIEEDFWNNCLRLPDAMPINATGVKTHLDAVFVGFSKNEINEAVLGFLDANWRNVPISSAWRASPLRKALLLKEALRTSDTLQVTDYAYRAFDTRKVAYLPTAIEAGDHRFPVMKHMQSDNIALVTTRQLSQGAFTHALVTRSIADMCLLSTATKECSYVFPLYILPEEGLLKNSGRGTNLSNLAQDCLKRFGGSPDDFLHYAFAILHSPTYRTRYTEFLKIDFPRIPLPGGLPLFQALAELGGELVVLHLLESPKVNVFITHFVGEGDNSVPKKPTYKDGAVWINPIQRFEGVPEAVWNFHVGGYQVCEKWLKDRKGRRLTEEDIAHYQKIVVALNETIHLMGEIDETIDKLGGWPGAFQAANQSSTS